MDGAALHEVTFRTALALPAVEETQPFGERSVVHKVVGRMFVLATTLRGVPIVNLKCAPPHGAALVRDHAEISPGWHMDKRHWITLSPGDGLDETMVEDLVANSYDLVVAGLPRNRRPLDPAASRRADGSDPAAREDLREVADDRRGESVPGVQHRAGPLG
ncbi:MULTISPECIES: MmcQ/YjbR family DNA-binding protein [unclassified Curtobacterium]|uniref:MmcQ/YjbR family DNA-binding protein n=1 Tax=unclassified Curtobacterium TaxID=257496 RepID=UPI00278B094C|nr:MmcQ/YjbR family DNA-binding protein [Curtobacterium sp. 260]MDP9735192.1 putative DNA-binding protein (MmcQ/YjbR family) [Curtobacterium sp. 260]